MTSAVSVRDRLKSLAKSQSLGVEEQFIDYAFEGLLRRIAFIDVDIKFVLKGGKLFNLLFPDLKRHTSDIDFAALNVNDMNEITDFFAKVVEMKIDDGLIFKQDVQMRKLTGLNVARISLTAMLGNSPISLRIDAGFQSHLPIEQESITISSPIRENADFTIMVYRIELIVAEKFHAMISHGMLNTRYKDFYDLHQIYQSGKTNPDILAQGILETFNSRELDIPLSTKLSVLDELRLASRHQERWAVFLRKNQLAFFEWDMAMDSIAALVDPSLKIIAEGKMTIEKAESKLTSLAGALTGTYANYDFEVERRDAWGD